MREASVSYPVKDWERIKVLGVHPSVASPETYAARVAVGMRLAQATLEAKQELVPSIPTLKGLHYITFESVHPWAGTFRKPGQEVKAGGLICSLAEDVTRDLLKLRREMENNSLEGSRQYKAEVLAFYHASLLAIHPFLDGNGRVARTVLAYQTKKLLGHELSPTVGREEYIAALGRAQDDGNLTPLARLVSRTGLVISHSRSHSGQRERESRFSDELLVSKPVVLDEGQGRGRRR